MSRIFIKSEFRRALIAVLVFLLLLVCLRWVIEERERRKISEVLDSTFNMALSLQCFGGPSSYRELTKDKDGELWKNIELHHFSERRDFNIWGKDGIGMYFRPDSSYGQETGPHLRLWIDWKRDEGWILSPSGIDIAMPKSQRMLEGRRLSEITCHRVKNYLRRDPVFLEWEKRATIWRER